MPYKCYLESFKALAFQYVELVLVRKGAICWAFDVQFAFGWLPGSRDVRLVQEVGWGCFVFWVKKIGEKTFRRRCKLALHHLVQNASFISSRSKASLVRLEPAAGRRKSVATATLSLEQGYIFKADCYLVQLRVEIQGGGGLERS
jgi:hypothetical protein